MKKIYSLMLAVVALLPMASSAQTTLARWTFNGDSNTTVAGGENSPTAVVALTSATASLVGGTTATFANGNSTAGTTETETTSPPNYGWNSTTYPTAGVENKSRGVQFAVSTLGYTGITFSFEQRLSNTAANTYRVQYTADVTASSPVWVDSQQFTVVPAPTGTGDTWYNGRSVDFSAISALDNNPNAAFRVVSEFDPGTGDYLAARSTSTYGGGTVRYDMVTVVASGSLGLQHFGLSDGFSMSPNPTRHGIVQFSDAQDVRVYDLSGKLVFKAEGATSVDTHDWSSGVYLLRTDSGVSRKLIVQ